MDESRAVLMRRETTLLSTRKEDRGSGIGRSTHSPRGITSRVSSERHKRRATTMTGYHKHHIQTPRIYTYSGSAQERMEKKNATPRYHSAQASAQMCSTPGQLSDDIAFQSKSPNAEKTCLIYHAPLLNKRAPVMEPRTVRSQKAQARLVLNSQFSA